MTNDLFQKVKVSLCGICSGMRDGVVRAVERTVTDISRRDAANKYQISTTSAAACLQCGRMLYLWFVK